MRSRWVVCVAAGLLAVAVVACGSSSKDEPATQLGETVIAEVTQVSPTTVEDMPVAETPASETPSTGRGQLAALASAAKGTWSGEYGRLTFNGDGTVKFSIRNCGTSGILAKGRPFGVLNDCEPIEYAGKLEVREHEYAVREESGAATILQAYIDSDGNLHVGSGTLDELDATGKGAINIYARGTLIVGDTCTYKDPSSAGTTAAKCGFSTKEGQRVLSYELPGSQPGDSPHTGELVHLPSLGLIVDPEIYVAEYSRQ